MVKLTNVDEIHKYELLLGKPIGEYSRYMSIKNNKTYIHTFETIKDKHNKNHFIHTIHSN